MRAAMHPAEEAPLEPIPASVLLKKAVERKDGLRRRGNILTGCGELDEYVLLGGFERGSVVGVSAEDGEIGLLIGLQTVARLLAGTAPGAPVPARPRAMIVTTLPARVLLPKLREVIVGQVAALQGGGLENVRDRVQWCLENISIARVFDIEGLWEVLSELDAQGQGPLESKDAVRSEPTLQREETREPDIRPAPKMEILDSEDEDDGLSPLNESPLDQETPLKSSEKPPPRSSQETPLKSNEKTPMSKQEPLPDSCPSLPLPDIILVTHMSTLLSTLFTGRDDKPAAHNTMLLLSSQLRHLTRSPSRGGPLIMLLNSATINSFTGGDESIPATDYNEHGPPPSTGLGFGTEHTATRPSDASLRSIFSPSRPGGYRGIGHVRALQRQATKPSFGLVFSKLLDLHLLCTRVPRTRGDAGVVETGLYFGGKSEIHLTWVVEVLLDELGVYCESDDRRTGWRRSREQRWAAVDVGEGGARTVDVG
ncbi:hypothetical protein B0T24DRAFT_427744 [Lasiosphaeria ovina]|uniref:Fasciclin domain family protein n=1 Tax=Lasiosphaeria ovina TaxID=92902 RepID=A0AAE0JWD1_9PEZI|nr:hypothetical protein B0T24DRAFT_427744 [Lasiosphaeria ovina]